MIRMLVAAVVLLVGSGEAWADKRVAVAAIEGDKSGAAAKAVVAALDGEGDMVVISPKAVTKAADELAIPIDDRQSGKLMEELEADVLVMGSVEAIQGGNKLTLRVVPKGARKSRSAVVLYGKKANSTRIHNGIRGAVTTLLEKAAADGLDAPVRSTEDGPSGVLDDEGEIPEATSKTGSREPRVVPKRAITGGTGSKRDRRFVTFKEESDPEAEISKSQGDPDAEDPNAEDGEEREAKPKASRRPVAARLNAGPSVLSRTLEFNHRGFAEAPKNYNNSFVPGARVQGEIYPAAFGSRGILANLGVGFTFDQTLGLKVNGPDGKLASTVRHFSVDARVRFPIGGGSISLVGGYGQRTFTVARGNSMLDLPNVDYKLFNPGLAFRVPLGPVTFFGDGRVLLMTNAGEIQTMASYGPGTVSAFEAEAGFEVAISKVFGVRLAGDFVGIGYDFNGKGALSNNRDGDAATIDVGGAAERYIGASLMAAIRY
jgi:hypothetical protein